MSKKNSWVQSVEKKIAAFAEKHSATYSKSKRELSASFEIGCLHALLNYYHARGFTQKAENLVAGAYRYLTTPSGNPHNFSYVSMTGNGRAFEVRQQVRVRSHLNSDIYFAPDISVLLAGSDIQGETVSDYASGKRPFYVALSDWVVAVHECKSMVPFPELLVSFVGMFVTAHAWYGKRSAKICQSKSGSHLAPSLFIGGTASGIHLRMIAALQKAFPLNIVVGLHQGTWNLYSGSKKLNLLKVHPQQS